jgi:hypothetical protein
VFLLFENVLAVKQNQGYLHEEIKESFKHFAVQEEVIPQKILIF